MSAKEEGPEDSAMTTEASSQDEEYTTRPSDQRQQQRRRGLNDGPKGYTTKTNAEEEEDYPGEFNNDSGGISGR